MTITEYLRDTNKVSLVSLVYYQEKRPRIICNDGFSMSVQAGSHLYCTPRENGADSYETVEIGFPSKKEELILEYAEDPNDPTETVYGYVPINLVEKVIEKHGGINDKIQTKQICDWRSHF